MCERAHLRQTHRRLIARFLQTLPQFTKGQQIAQGDLATDVLSLAGVITKDALIGVVNETGWHIGLFGIGLKSSTDTINQSIPEQLKQ
jgi:hypothetical protein